MFLNERKKKRMSTSIKRSHKDCNKCRSPKNRRRSKRYAKKSQGLKSKLKGGSKEDDQLKYFNNNFRMLDKRYLSHVKPVYDLFLWNNKEVEKIILSYQRNIKLDYNGDFLTFQGIEPLRENKQVSILMVDFGTYQVENQFLKFQLNFERNLNVFIPVFKTSDGFQIGGNCYIDLSFYNRYKFTSPIVTGDMLKSILIDYYQTVDPRTGATKAVSDYVERKEYLQKKISKDFQDSINNKRRYVLNEREFNLYVNLEIINKKDFGWYNDNRQQINVYLKNLSEEEKKPFYIH